MKRKELRKEEAQKKVNSGPTERAGRQSWEDRTRVKENIDQLAQREGRGQFSEEVRGGNVYNGGCATRSKTTERSGDKRTLDGT